jgi:uncharacterized membrane protein YgcG
MVQQGSVPRWLLLLILLIAIGIIGLAVVFLGPLVASWLSSPTVSSFMVGQMQLDADVEQASVAGHLECSDRTPLPEMRIVVYVTGVRPNQEGEWRRSSVPCVAEIGKEWTLSSNCTIFPKEYSAFSLIATLVMKDRAAYLPSKLVASDEDELRSKLLKYVYRCDNCTPCNCISPVVTVSRSSHPVAVAEAETPTPPAPAFTPTPTSTISPAATHMPTVTPIPPSPTLSPSPTLKPTPIIPMATHTLPPALSPWNPAIPVPTAPPGYDPNVACVVNPCAPAPQLIDPQNGTEFIVNSSIELRWEWAYCLPPEWKFAIRISETSPPHSYRYEDNPKLISCENGKAVGRYCLPEDSRFRNTPGTYYWNIAVARSVEGGWERLSEESETRSFIVQSSGGGGGGGGGSSSGGGGGGGDEPP